MTVGQTTQELEHKNLWDKKKDMKMRIKNGIFLKYKFLKWKFPVNWFNSFFQSQSSKSSIPGILRLAHLDVMHAHEIPTVVQVLFQVTVLEDTTATVSTLKIYPQHICVWSTPFQNTTRAELNSQDTRTPE